MDLFAGPGGWDLAARELGIDVTGIEHDPTACETRRAALLRTIEGDVRDYGPGNFRADGLIASPPCQTFSTAGRKNGCASLEDVLLAVKLLEHDIEHRARFTDERTTLVLEPLRWALEAADIGIPYRWLAFEQVPTVLPVWQAMADVIRRLGYSVAAGVLDAERYGVPQTRKRAVLIAKLDGEAHLPEPTHSRYFPNDWLRLEHGVRPWVSMAEALGWPATDRKASVMAGSGTSCYLVDPRPVDAPAQTITGAGTAEWGWRPTRAQGRGDRDPRGFRLTAEEMAILQTFPPDHPWQGNQGERYQQIGNAVPPLLARAVLTSIADL